MSSFRALSEVRERGLFCSLYADRADWHTPEAGGTVDKDKPTQVGRALQQLDIELIAAYSPEARGRSERMFGTLQKRLPQELRLAGITVNRALPATTQRPDQGSAFVPFTGALDDASTGTARWLQAPGTSAPAATVKARVRPRIPRRHNGRSMDRSGAIPRRWPTDRQRKARTPTTGALWTSGQPRRA